MKSKMLQVTALLAVFTFVGSASALCPKDSRCGMKKGVSTVAAKVAIDGRSDKPDAASAGAKSLCCGNCASCSHCKKNNGGNCADCPKCKSASLTAAQSPCGLDCNRGCCKKGVKTVAGKFPCSAKGGKSLARLTAGNGPFKNCPHAAKSVKEGQCPIGKKVNAVLASLPKLKYKVGDDITLCSQSAAAMAKESDKALKYVIGEDVFETETEASAKLVALYEKEIHSLKSIRFAVGGDCFRCPVTAKGKAKDSGKKIAYRVGGFDFPEKQQAEKALKLISEAVADVKMVYKVGDKSFCCDKMASARVKETGSTLSYVVGDDITTSEFSARVKLAEAKIRTIIRTAAAAQGS